jgi:hypothetical protein
MGVRKGGANLKAEYKLLTDGAYCFACGVTQKGCVEIDFGEVNIFCKRCLSIAHNIAQGNILYKVVQRTKSGVKILAKALTFQEARQLYEGLGGTKNETLHTELDTGG